MPSSFLAHHQPKLSFLQMNTSMVYQGEYMNINIAGFTIPIATLSIFDTLGVLLLIPFMDKIVYPLFEKAGFQRPSQLKRIGIGMLVASASMTCAGGIEVFRRQNCCMLQDRKGDDGNGTRISDISILYQIPQYTLVGLGEIFTSVTGKFSSIYIEVDVCISSRQMTISRFIYHRSNRSADIPPFPNARIYPSTNMWGRGANCTVGSTHIIGITLEE